MTQSRYYSFRMSDACNALSIHSVLVLQTDKLDLKLIMTNIRLHRGRMGLYMDNFKVNLCK